MSHSVDLLITPSWVIPVDPNAHPLHSALTDHAVAIDRGRIVAVTSRASAELEYEPRHRLDLPGHALIPGLINAHTHAAMTMMRGLADDLPLMTWLREHIWPAESHWVGPPLVAEGSRHAIAEMLRGGTTCFNDMYFFPNVVAEVAAEVGMRAVVGLILIDFPTAWAEAPEQYLEKGLAVHNSFAAHPHIHTALAPHAPYTVSDGALIRARDLAAELTIPIHIHLHETADEVASAEQEQGMRPLARLDRLGLIGPSTLAVHMTQLRETEIERVAAAGCHVVHCPESNLKLASGFCPVDALRRAGVNVALGTDGAASNNDLDLLAEMRTAALLAKGVAEDASAVPAAEALRMATLAGAEALGLADQIGSISCGKSADLVAIDLKQIESLPLYNPISQIVYATRREQVRHVWVAGRQLLDDGRLTTLDEEEICAKAVQWQQRFEPRAC